MLQILVLHQSSEEVLLDTTALVFHYFIGFIVLMLKRTGLESRDFDYHSFLNAQWTWSSLEFGKRAKNV